MLTPSMVHIDVPLQNFSVAYAQKQTTFIADKIFPIVSVDKQSDKFYVFDKNQMRQRGPVKQLAPRTEVERIGIQLSKDNYFAEVYGLGMDFDEQTTANEDAGLNLRQQGVETLTEQMLHFREDQFIQRFLMDHSQWNTLVANQDFDPLGDVGKDPVDTMLSIMTEFYKKSGGYKPNTLVLSPDVRQALLVNEKIRDRIQYAGSPTNPAIATDQTLAAILGVERIFVPDLLINKSAPEVFKEPEDLENNFVNAGELDKDNENVDYAYKNTAFLCYTPSNAGLRTPAAGVIFAWNSIPGANNLGITVESFSDDALKRKQISEMIQVKMSYDMKVVGKHMGMLLSNAGHGGDA